MQSKLTNVTLASIKAERAAVMQSVRRKGRGGYVTDGGCWYIKTLDRPDGDHDILLEGFGSIRMKDIQDALAQRGDQDVWIEGQVDWHANLRDYIEGNTDWTCGDLTDYWTVVLAEGERNDIK